MLSGMRLTFAGAAGTVTGSMHHLEVEGRNYLLDCGMYQGRRREAEKRNRYFPFPARSLDAVILSHAHIDHSGRLPLLVRNGFRGPIYATPATIDLCHAMLRDTAHILESDAKFVNKHHPGEEPAEPLYSTEDADQTMPLFHPVPLHTPTNLGGNLVMESWDAGHILGSSPATLKPCPSPASPSLAPPSSVASGWCSIRRGCACSRPWPGRWARRTCRIS